MLLIMIIPVTVILMNDYDIALEVNSTTPLAKVS